MALLGLPKRHLASPRARKRARELGVVLPEIRGRGPEGRIIEKDVVEHSRFLSQRPTTKETNKQPLLTPLATKWLSYNHVSLESIEPFIQNVNKYRSSLEDIEEAFKKSSINLNIQNYKSILPLNPMRRTIAKTVSESAHTHTHVTLNMQVNMAQVKEYRKSVAKQLTYTDIFIKVVAKSLRKFPLLNATYTDDGIVIHPDVNVGIAVALDDGLVVPVVRNADCKSINEISEIRRDLIYKAKSNRLSVDDMSSGTFTISNLGMYDVDIFTPIINGKESAILGVGRIRDGVIVDHGAIRIVPLMNLSLSFDHRAMDGAPAAQFLKSIKDSLEETLLIYEECKK